MSDLSEKLARQLGCDVSDINIHETENLTVTFLSVDDCREREWHLSRWTYSDLYDDGFEYVGRFDHCYMFKYNLKLPPVNKRL